MKYFVYILIIIIISLGILLKNTFDDLSFVNAKFNIQKKTANNLHKKNKALISQKNKIRTKLKDRRKHIIQKHLRRSEKKIALAPTKMIPFVGMPLIITMTAYDIKESCDDIKEFKVFEKDICNIAYDNNNDTEDDICGLNIDELKMIIKKQYENIASAK
ncbi:MAG: hypothetical protein HOF69_03985 [Campylobacteraceae bacterium]|jgi:hypothetical protein|nr:hypothetical protein [Campylobacteraceae bacterium]MBT3882404.1 hypothetical protein [Campylobacteraceae bacterium]MBT4030796.1 hypothetical protein [Campylobacteraceae bacterium]MBT4179872.1 hypothetical protein [Campylobacteraceae bacterium]MBT4572387.1 hypothetical protein [Campylobacteraceae bacterium]